MPLCTPSKVQRPYQPQNNEAVAGSASPVLKPRQDAQPKKQTSPKKLEFKFSLGNDRFVTVGFFRKDIRIGIRQFKTDSDGVFLTPNQPGISLLLDQWEKLKSHSADVQEAVIKKADICRPLGGDRYVTTTRFGRYNNMFIHIRNHFTSELGKLLPSKYGISLRADEWETLCGLHSEIDNAIEMMRTDVKVDGKTIIKTVYVFFSEHPCWQYCVLETGETFYSTSGDPTTAYKDYVKGVEKNNSGE